MELPYVAFTEPCVFGLDEDGVCREVVPRSGASEKDIAIARRCLGAQYVASLDASVDGLLTQLPQAGARLLFACTNDDGRIVLVRSAEVERFDSREELAIHEEEDKHRRDNEETAPFSRKQRASGASIHELDLELDAPTRRSPIAPDSEPITRKSPATVRGFPPPPAVYGT